MKNSALSGYATIVAFLLLSTANAHGQVPDQLTGKMRWWQQVAGTWNARFTCTLWLANRGLRTGSNDGHADARQHPAYTL